MDTLVSKKTLKQMVSHNGEFLMWFYGLNVELAVSVDRKRLLRQRPYDHHVCGLNLSTTLIPREGLQAQAFHSRFTKEV